MEQSLHDMLVAVGRGVSSFGLRDFDKFNTVYIRPSSSLGYAFYYQGDDKHVVSCYVHKDNLIVTRTVHTPEKILNAIGQEVSPDKTYRCANSCMIKIPITPNSQ